MRPLSQDLRQRIIAARERGQGTGEVCKRFGVSRKSVERFWKQHCRTGVCEPKQIGGYRRSRLEKHDRTLQRWIAAVSDFAEAVDKLRGRAIGEAVEGFLRTVVSIQRTDINKAVEEFIEGRKHKSQAQDGKRAQMSREYSCHVAMWLREFARTFPGTAVSELTKEHLDAYIKSHTDVAAKSRNDRRATVKMFLSWSVRKDYLPVNHRLFEAEGMAREIVETAETEFYRPKELQKLLNTADADLLPVIALGAILKYMESTAPIQASYAFYM